MTTRPTTATPTPRSSSRAMKAKLLYGLMVLLTVGAVQLSTQSKQSLRNLSSAVLQALQYTAMARMEQSEANVLHNQAEYDATVARDDERQAQFLAHRARDETILAQRARVRGQYFERLTVIEDQETKAMRSQVQEDDAMRIGLEANLTSDQQEFVTLLWSEQEQQQQQQQPNGCSDYIWPFESFCTILGAIPGLSRKTERDEDAFNNNKIELSKLARQILRESHDLTYVERRKYLDQVVTAILQGQTDEYNQTAVYLQWSAAQLDARAQQDRESSRRANESAAEAWTETERVNAMIAREDAWDQGNAAAAQDLMIQAERLGRAARETAIGAVVLAFVALVFFASKMGVWIGDIVQAVRDRDSRSRDMDLLWSASYIIQHVLIFLLVTGVMNNSEYQLLHLDDFDVAKRAAIVLWFAYLGAGVQAILLHTIPHCMSVRHTTLDREALFQVALQFFWRLLAGMAFFVMELLIAWLTLRNVLFTESNIHALSSVGFYFYFVLMISIHLGVFEPRVLSLSRHVDEQSTVLMSDDDDTADIDEMAIESAVPTETSPLREVDTLSSSPTFELPFFFFRNNNQPSSIGSFRSNLTSPYAIDFGWERMKLIATFEILLVICAACVVRNSATTATPFLTANIIRVIFFAMALLVACLLGWRLICNRHGIPTAVVTWSSRSASIPGKAYLYEAVIDV